ncbi:MAG TPA: STAS domain-containing protein [Thermoflexales bacterium]|mgnify:CR=1 FL=1|nr:STAS domain-containing protein [Thermoflexales bacterium]HQW33967.1 STAS domain-containing protein [Thermoflexales bacterium]HQZ22890.1 STAS domain-containing protein [Thermoflexales bacterium]HRA00405.1 STAS domain-containing protein [Thermoflexales bacterium]
MQLKVKQLKHVDIVSVDGRVDSMTAPELDTALKGLVEKGRRKIVIDLSKCQYVSSAGLRAMLSALKQVKGGGNLVLVGASPQIRETLQLVGFHTLFTQFDDILDAVDSF